MPHRRSQRSIRKRGEKAEQRREAARIVSQHAIRDLQVKESINALTPGLVALHLQDRFGTFDVSVVNNFDQGEILSDMYRRGSLQQIGAILD